MVLAILLITKHQYYYVPKKGKRGREPVNEVQTIEGFTLTHQEVITGINKVKTEEKYGYHKITVRLKMMGWIINHKKVYRLMSESQLLEPKVKYKPKNYENIGKYFPSVLFMY